MRARVIRAAPSDDTVRRTPSPERGRLLRRSEVEATSRAAALIADAERAAERLRQHAEAECERLQAEARRRGQAEAARQLARLTENAGQQLHNLLEELRGDCTRLGIAIAEKLLGEQLRLTPATVVQLVSQVLRMAAPSTRLVIRVHPEDLALLEDAIAHLRAVGTAEHLVLEADPGVSRGGCVLESPMGQVDGQLETQLRAIAAALVEASSD